LKKNIFLVLILVVAVLFFFFKGELKRTYLLRNSGVYGLDTKELIIALENNLLEDILVASIDDEFIVYYIQEERYVHKLEVDLHYISFAPYIGLTHECYIHSLTGCQGELLMEDVYIEIYDESGEKIFSDTLNTGEDGFIGLFLESNKVYNVKVESSGYSSEFQIDGYSKQTCYTEVKLR